MSKNILAVCLAILLTALTCSVGSRLLLGEGAGQELFGLLFIGFPVVIILFGLFYSLADQIIPKYERILIVKNEEVLALRWPIILNIIGYVEVATGIFGSAIF